MSREKEARRLRQVRDRGVLESGDYVTIGSPDDLPIPEIMRWSLEETVRRILPLERRYQDTTENFFQSFFPGYEDLQLCPSVNRMIGLRQFGIKTDLPAAKAIVRSDGFLEQVVSVPFLHSRWDHCQIAAAVMIAFGIELRLDYKAIATGAFGALLHDIGHSAFGHDLDDILVSMGHPNHEERGIKVIQTDEDIHESFDLAEVETDDVVRVIREEGLLGQLMSVADTLSYVVLDSHVTPLVSTIPFELIWQVVGSIDGVEDDRYRVSSIDPLLKLVWHRADLYRDLYAAYPNRISAFVLRNFYRATIELNVFSAQDFIQGTDGDIKMLLPFKLQDPQVQARLPDWFSAVRDMAFGFFWTPDRWQHLRLNSEVKARAVLNRLNQSELDTSVLIPPFDYRRKTYRVIELVDGDKVDLQAPESHVTGEHLLWHVLYLAS